jgi:glucose-1-phosphate thymidylyltransferase
MTVALILAGGYGKRLRPLTDDKPKPLVEVAGKPIIMWQIEWLKKHGITDFVVLAGYRKEKIIESLGSGSKLGVSVSYVIEDEPLGTGGAIKNARLIYSSQEFFIVVNGDIITNIDVEPLFDSLKGDPQAVAAMALVQLRSPYGIVETDNFNHVISFKEKPIIGNYWINAGVYVMRSSIVEYLPDRGDIERTAFPKLAAEGKLIAVKYELTKNYWKSIDTYKDLEEASVDLQATPLI